VGRLDWAPVVALDAASTVYLYDLTDRTRQEGETELVRTPGRTAGRPVRGASQTDSVQLVGRPRATLMLARLGA